MKKQELIDVYQKNHDDYMSLAKKALELMKGSRDEVDAALWSSEMSEYQLIASMCSAFVKNLKKLEDVK